MYLVLLLLCLRWRTAYLLPMANKKLDLVTLVDENESFFSSVLIYEISSRCKKPAFTTLKVMSMFCFLILTGLSAEIFSRLSYVIGKGVVFCLRNSLLPLLMMSTLQRVSKTF